MIFKWEVCAFAPSRVYHGTVISNEIIWRARSTVLVKGQPLLQQQTLWQYSISVPAGSRLYWSLALRLKTSREVNME